MMHWLRGSQGFPGGGRNLLVRVVNSAVMVWIVLVSASLALLLTAPVAGDFSWPDAPRHAMNGVFVMDFVAAHPLGNPSQWAIDYYLQRPALTILFYPPLFYCVEAVAFALFGVSRFVSQATVALFVILLAGSVYTLARLFLPRWSAVGAALIAIGGPETAFWGRQVMLDVPAYALIAASACCLAAYIKNGRPLAIYLTAALLLAALYTKYNAVFVAPALIGAFIVAKGGAALRDRHALIAAGLAVIGTLPAAFIMLRFGFRNVESVSALSDTLPLSSLECWLFYIRNLPGQVGILTLCLATGGLAVTLMRFVRGPDRWTYGLLLAWFAVGYLVFSLISVKEPRHSIMILMPLAVTAPLFLLAVLPRRVGETAGFTLGVCTLLYTLIFCPVSRVDGYQDIAAFLVRNVPPNGVVAYSGYRDGNLIFDLGTFRSRSDITVVRIDKLLLAVPAGERRRGVKQEAYDETAIAQLLRGLGASYFVVQPGFWSDLAIMSRFDTAIRGPDYQKAAHFSLTGTLSTVDGTEGIDILQPTYEVVSKARHLNIDMPILNQRFEGAIRP